MEWAVLQCLARDGEDFYQIRSVTGLLTISNEAYKHIFTSPSSVDQEPKAMRSGNVRIHGMTQVTPASIAYVATQVSLIVFPSHTGNSLTVINSLFAVFFARIFKDRHHYGFGVVLFINPGSV
jgi:hypothetical protein